jgi:molybdate transport system ATP-binding protein
MIEVKDVSVRRAGVPLLQDITWRIAAGEHWVINGANGAGKTWLLELLAGNIHPTTGEVVYDFVQGATWDDRFALRKKHIHYIPAHALQIFLRQHEMFYQQRYYSMGDERVPRVKDILGVNADAFDALGMPATFNVASLLEIEVTRLSNGQLKKVMILQNLVRGLPSVLLFDYPFEGLDHASRADLATFLDGLARHHGITLIMTDHGHHLPEAINRRLVMAAGTVKAVEAAQPSSPSTSPVATTTATQQQEGTPIVEMKGVAIRYGSRTILEDFHWTIRQGERWALTGRNGSGKTTLFSLIFADHPMAYSQPVFLFGKRRGSGESIWDIKNRINYFGPELISYLAPQYRPETARAWIVQQHRQLNQPALAHAIEHFHAQGFIDRPVKTLSSGQLQVMLIISNLVSGRELLLLDEPYQFLDPANKERLNDYLQEHLHASTTLVLITHYEEDITRWTQQRLSLQ